MSKMLIPKACRLFADALWHICQLYVLMSTRPVRSWASTASFTWFQFYSHLAHQIPVLAACLLKGSCPVLLLRIFCWVVFLWHAPWGRFQDDEQWLIGVEAVFMFDFLWFCHSELCMGEFDSLNSCTVKPWKWGPVASDRITSKNSSWNWLGCRAVSPWSHHM